MPSVREARETRRRKILARAPDRLAYITGGSSSINLLSSSSSVGVTRTGDDRGTNSVVEPEAAASSQLAGGLSSAMSGEFDESHIPSGREVVRNGYGRSTSGKQNLPEKKNPSTAGFRSRTFSFTWDGLGCSIEVTQTCRAYGAFLIALILAARNCSIRLTLEGLAKFDHILVPWPLVMVCLSDASLVIGALLLKLAGSRHADPVEVTQQDQFFQFDLVSDHLRSGIVAMTVIFNATQALFLDCSIYVVVVICAHSAAQVFISAS